MKNGHTSIFLHSSFVFWLSESIINKSFLLEIFLCDYVMLEFSRLSEGSARRIRVRIQTYLYVTLFLKEQNSDKIVDFLAKDSNPEALARQSRMRLVGKRSIAP